MHDANLNSHLWVVMRPKGFYDHRGNPVAVFDWSAPEVKILLETSFILYGSGI